MTHISPLDLYSLRSGKVLLVSVLSMMFAEPELDTDDEDEENLECVAEEQTYKDGGKVVAKEGAKGRREKQRV
jgi:hypothetical protein